MNRDPKRRPEPFRAIDFMPRYGEPDEEAKPNGMAADTIGPLMERLMIHQDRVLRERG